MQDLTDGIIKVLVNRKKNEIMIFYRETVSPKIKETIHRAFKECKDVKLQFYAIEEGKDLEKFVESYWELLCRIWREYHPSCSGWLRECRYRVKENRLNLVFSSDIAIQTLESKKFSVLAKRILDALYKEKVDIKMLWETDVGRDKTPVLRKEEIFEIKRIISMNGNKNKRNKRTGKTLLGKTFNGEARSISQVNQEAGTVIMEGIVFKVECKDIKSDKFSKIISIYVTDYQDSTIVRIFADRDKEQHLSKALKPGLRLKIRGEIQYNRYIKENIVIARDIMQLAAEERTDTADRKRVELHAHTRFSAMDGIAPVEDLIKRASQWGLKAIAITDHGVVQAFPHAYIAAEKLGVKVIYGVEGYLVNDEKVQVYSGDRGYGINDEIVVVDIETTGLDPIKDRITEIGAVKLRKGNIVDRFSQLINPGIPIPSKITDLTGITNHMVEDCPGIEVVLPRFLSFAEGCVVAAHNAFFDIGFIRQKAACLDIEFKNPVLDTLNLTRFLYPELKSHKLNIVARHLGVRLDRHHRAEDDALATAHILVKCLNTVGEMGIEGFEELNRKVKDNVDITKQKTYHVIILAKNQAGLENLYRIISRSHLEYFHKVPRIPRSLLGEMREGLIIGSACEAGELYRGFVERRTREQLREIAGFYDYLEIQPIGNNHFLVDNGTVKGIDDLERINREIYQLGKEMGIPVVATGDVHFLEPQDEIFRRIIMAGKGFEDADNQAPLYLRTTGEMLEEFQHLGPEAANEVVVDNPQKINQDIEEIIPVPLQTYPPKIPGSDEELKEMTLDRAIGMYGDPLPQIVKKRLVKELNAIINNGYAVMYIIAQKLVNKSMKDGYLVGSRGSVGSSLVATMSGITEVNPLPPHYLCSECKFSEFITDGSVGTGADLPDRECPRCHRPLKKLGFDIPFEVFMGFEGDKEPDIDLNFSGEYQGRAHRFTEELFGKDHVFRAGTIATMADKTAYGFVKNYIEERGLTVHSAEVNRLVEGCTGIKRTTGQHPGGIMIVPKDMDIHQFTPVQRPADDASSEVITTHFDYHAISGRLLKLDILGHDDPTMLKMLHNITGYDPRNISLDDRMTMELFRSTSPLGIKAKDIDCEVGTLGIPEFGTRFVRQMLVDTRPTTFEELIRISGLSHGTDVWLNNAQDLIKSGTATLREVIATRDDIMTYLIQKGMEPGLAFRIMENVRKGKGLDKDEIRAMKLAGVNPWYIASCEKIKYMFPKAHAVAYVTMAFRIAYYKVYHPLAFYTAYFTVKADEFDAHLIIGGKDKVINTIRELEKKGAGATQKEKSLLTILEVVREMYCRGYGFFPVDIYKSHEKEFRIIDNRLLPPLNSLQGLGESAAKNIIEARMQGAFISVEDLRERGKLSSNVVEILERHGCLKDLPVSNQISLF